MDLPVAASIIVSAGTYLFDFVSNIAVVIEYSRYDCDSLMSKGICSTVKEALNALVICMLGVLVLAHTLNAVMFKLKFKQEDAPWRAAYFLPLIHLWRLADLLWRTLSFKGVRDLRSGEMNGLYCILGSSLEGAPLLMLQICAYLTLSRYSAISGDRSVFVGVSFIASALSVAYNGATSILSVAKNAKTFNARLTLALAAGFFTLFATGSRCITYALLIMSPHYFCRLLQCRPLTMPLFFVLRLAFYWLFYWLLQFPKASSQRLRDPKRCLASFTFAYMSIILGPLYPMVSEAKDAGQLGRPIFHARLVLVVLLSVSGDGTLLTYPIYKHAVNHSLTLVYLIGAVGCVVSMCGYIGIEIAISKLYSRFEELHGEGLKINRGVDLDGCEVTNQSMRENCISYEGGFFEEEDHSAHAIVSLSDIEIELHKPKEDWDDDHSKKNRGVDSDGCEEVTNPCLISKEQSLSLVTGKSMRESCNSDDDEEILKEDDTRSSAHAIDVSLSDIVMG